MGKTNPRLFDKKEGLESQLNEKDKQIAEKDKQIKEKDNKISSLNSRVTELEKLKASKKAGEITEDDIKVAFVDGLPAGTQLS